MRRTSQFVTVHTEGGLLPTDLLQRVVEGDPSLAGIGPEAYHLGPGERINEAVTRSWNRLTGAFAAFEEQLAQAPANDKTATTLTRKWLQALLQELGFGQVQTAAAVEIDGKTYPVSHGWGHVPIHLVGALVALDTRTEGVAGAARVSPHGLVQELLNRSNVHLWAIVSNGRRLRLLRDHASLTRQAYVEFDLEGMFSGQVYSDFVLLWHLCHQSRFEGDPPEKCLLEQWASDAAQKGTRALDDLRRNVEAAITNLGQGFLAHPDNAALREKLRSGDLSTQDYYRQLLRLVYRLLFISVAEARDLLLLRVPAGIETARLRYQRFYSLDRIRTLAEVRRGANHPDVWLQLQIVMRALSSDSGEPALALPALGSFLWSAQAMPDLESALLGNRHFLEAIRALSRIEDGKVIRSIDYRNLGSEELGSVYESLLELHPDLHPDTAAFALKTAGGHERKTTGSYYTPTSLINELLDSALEPVLAEAAAASDPEESILALTVLDPACGSGHFLIAAAQRIAKRLATTRTGDDEPSPEALRTALRDVVMRCLYGIDVNPMAVELCKVSLWMEAVEPGKPLGFLEHHIVCGNSLLGATPALLERGVPDEAFKPLTGDDKAIVSAWKKRNKDERKNRVGQGVLQLGSSAADLARPIADGIAAINAISGDDAAQIHEQERRFADLQRSTAALRAKFHADAWCAAFVAPKTKGAPVLTDSAVRRIASDPTTVEPELLKSVRLLAEQFNFLHLHLAFPTVLQPSTATDDEPCGWGGGFSVVLGNPPWEKVRLSEKEFFVVRAPEVAQAAGAKRKRIIEQLQVVDPALWDEFRSALRAAEGESHLLLSSARYPLCGRGDVNTYAVFAELMRDAVNPTGRVGVIVPTGIATDDTTKLFFADCVDSRSLVSLFDFENRKALFADIDSRVKFCLLTLAGTDRPSGAAAFAFFVHDPADLSEPDRRFTLTSDDIALINPNTKTAPVFRSRRDAELTAAIYRRVPVFVREGHSDGNPWSVDFSTMFHMTGDSSLFRSSTELDSAGAKLDGNIWHKGGQRWLPLYEAKMMWFYDARAADVVISATALVRQGQPSALTDLDKSDSTRLPNPRYWVPDAEIDGRLKGWQHDWLVSFRNVTSPSNERTLVPNVCPRAGLGHSSPALFASGRVDASVKLCTLLASFVIDYQARQKLGGTNFTFFILKQLPVLTPEAFDAPAPWETIRTVGDWFMPRVLELSYTAWDLEGLGKDLGYDGPPFRWDPPRRELLRAELDAACFHLYGIERGDVDYIMETFPIVKRMDIAAHGEYRTKCLILDAYDAMTSAIRTGEPCETILDPPPADSSCAHAESTRPDWAKSG